MKKVFLDFLAYYIIGIFALGTIVILYVFAPKVFLVLTIALILSLIITWAIQRVL